MWLHLIPPSFPVSLRPSLLLTFLHSGLVPSTGNMEAASVVAAVIENAASGPKGEPGSGDVLER